MNDTAQALSGTVLCPAPGLQAVLTPTGADSEQALSLAAVGHPFLGPKRQGLPGPRALPLSPQCSYIPGSLDNYQLARADVEGVRGRFQEHRAFRCFAAPRENETRVLYRRLYGPQTLLFSLFWPTFLLTGGLLIIAMVKLNQSLSILAAQK